MDVGIIVDQFGAQGAECSNRPFQRGTDLGATTLARASDRMISLSATQHDKHTVLLPSDQAIETQSKVAYRLSVSVEIRLNCTGLLPHGCETGDQIFDCIRFLATCGDGEVRRDAVEIVGFAQEVFSELPTQVVDAVAQMVHVSCVRRRRSGQGHGDR